MTACELKPSRHSHGAVALLGVITFCVAALAQDPSGRMLSSSVLVFAAVREKGKPVPVNRAGGFLLDARHVMTNVKDCCAVTQKGQQPVPVVVAGKDSAVGKVIWSSQESETAILELDNPLGDAALTIAPTKLTRKGQDVYTVQYADSGPPKLGPGKLQDLVKVKDSNLPIYQTTAPMADGNSGGALFDACGNVIGVNLLVKDGIGYAVAIDPLLGALESAGLKATQAAKPCGGESAGKHGGEETDNRHGWRMPRGTEWIAVILLLGVLGLALRPAARRRMAATVAPPLPPLPLALSPLPPGHGPRPVLRGVSGDYAGSALALEASPSILGRDPRGANLLFRAESGVSKRHCTVSWDASRSVFVLEDHGSTNGTFLAAGERLSPHQPRDLQPGDRFYIGDLRNQFEVGLEEAQTD